MYVVGRWEDLSGALEERRVGVGVHVHVVCVCVCVCMCVRWCACVFALYTVWQKFLTGLDFQES